MDEYNPQLRPRSEREPKPKIDWPLILIFGTSATAGILMMAWIICNFTGAAAA